MKSIKTNPNSAKELDKGKIVNKLYCITNYDIIAYFLNLASCSEHFISIKHRILATFNINKKNSILTACMPLIMQKIISELCPFNNVLIQMLLHDAIRDAQAVVLYIATKFLLLHDLIRCTSCG
jgi:hypothetical protein